MYDRKRFVLKPSRLARSLATGVTTCLLLAFVATVYADGPAGPLKITGVEVGFGGVYRAGNWTPVRVTLQSEVEGDATLSVVVPDGDGVPSRVSRQIELQKAEASADAGPPEQVHTIYARFGRVHSDMTISVTVKTKVKEVTQSAQLKVSYRPEDAGPYRPAVSAEEALVVIVGGKTDIIDQAIRATNRSTAEHTVAASVLDPGDLPGDRLGYDGVAKLVLPLSDPAVARQIFGKMSYRNEAIRQWVSEGGHLVLLGGQIDPKVIKERENTTMGYLPFLELLPGKPIGTTPLERVRVLEDYIDTHAAIPVPSGQRRHNVPVFELAEPQGTVEVRSGKIPLIVEKAYGLGTVTFLAVDPTAAPFDGWRDRGQMMAQLLGMPEKSIDIEATSGGAVRHLGFTDLSGQMRSALDRFDGVNLIPFGLIVALVLVYVLLIGPADYFLLKKIGRMSWTWVTFTLIVVLFGVGTLWLAYRMKGDRLHLHRVDLVDVDVTGGGQVRGTSWANLFSPGDTRYDLAFSCIFPDIKQREGDSNLFSWLGLPGRGLGGMNPRAVETSVWRRPYEIIPEKQNQPDGIVMEGVPLLQWSTKSFTARWTGTWTETADAPAALRSRFKLREEDELPIGRVTNPLGDQPLENCLLIYDRWAYRLGTLEPGESVRIDGVRGRVRLNTLLTGRKMVVDVENKKQMREQITPYDTESADPAYILRMMMFYEVAGGRRYARLSNRYQPFVDLSDLLAPGRAMLVGQLPADAPATTRLTVDGNPVEADRHMTVFRFLVPVDVE